MERFGNERLIRECKRHRGRILIIATIPMHEYIVRWSYEEASVVNMAISALPHIHVHAVIPVQADVFSTVCDLVDSDDSLKDFHEPF